MNNLEVKILTYSCHMVIIMLVSNCFQMHEVPKNTLNNVWTHILVVPTDKIGYYFRT